MRRIIYWLSIAALLCALTNATAQKKWQRMKSSSPNPLPGISFAAGSAPELWRLQTRLKDTLDPSDVDAVSREVAWICGAVKAYRTTDAGQTWVPTATVSTTEWFSVITALNADTAFAGGCGPECFGGDANIYRTTDAGQTWTAVYTATGPSSYWNGVHFFDANNGIAFSDPPDGNAFLIVKTTDAGATWTPIANPPTVNENEFGIFKTLSFHDNLNGWFGTAGFEGGIGGRVFRTIDGGNTWTGYNSGNTNFVWAVQFISPMIGIRTSTFPPFLTRSTDGGQTWTEVSNLPVANIEFMQAATGVNTPGQNQLWVYGEAGTGPPPFTPFVLTSIDGGETWREQSIANLSGSTVVDMSAVSFGATGDSVQAWGVTWAFVDPSFPGGHILNYRQRLGMVTKVEEQPPLPLEFTLSQNYPNPFNPETEIRFHIAAATPVVLKIFNTLGEEIRTLVNAKHAAGSYVAPWDGRNARGEKMASGVYFYRLEAGSFIETKKMVLLP